MPKIAYCLRSVSHVKPRLLIPVFLSWRVYIQTSFFFFFLRAHVKKPRLHFDMLFYCSGRIIHFFFVVVNICTWKYLSQVPKWVEVGQ